MIEIKFKFNIGTLVTDALGTLGIVTGLLFDKAGVQYLVRTTITSQWIPEDELSLQSDKK